MYRVVLVDDERLIIRGLSSVVPWAELGCEVTGVAYDGKSGLEQIRSLKPDIVLTDIRMPNMDGLTMLAAIRSEHPEIQTAVLTAYRDFDYARQALTLGVCRYLLKPSNLEELKEAVRLMVSRLDAMPARKEEQEEETLHAAGNHRETEQSFFDLLGSLRIGKAKELLADPSMRIQDVAEATGFSDVAHFSRSFKRFAGCTPGEYRNQRE